MSLLQSVLEARERRFARKLELIHEGAVVSAMLRAPQSLRVEPAFARLHAARCARLEEKFRAAGVSLRAAADFSDAEGPCRLWLCDDAARAKCLCIEAEEEAGGALMDFDVMDECGAVLSRAQFGRPPRNCIVCDAPARVCIVSAAHSRDEIENAARACAEAYRKK